MANDDGFHKFKHGVEEALHGVEEAFIEAKEHVLLSVRNHTYVIAFVLMSLTSAILVFGTVYVWCFHHGHTVNRSRESSTSDTPQKEKAKRSKLRKPKTAAKAKTMPTNSGDDIASNQQDGTELRQRNVPHVHDKQTDIHTSVGVTVTPVSSTSDDASYCTTPDSNGVDNYFPNDSKNESSPKSKIPILRQNSNKKQS